MASNISPNEFETFLQRWLVKQEHYLEELASIQEGAGEALIADLNDLVARVLGHYQEYFEEKSQGLRNDVFAFFCPTWETHLEIAFSWIAGFKPGLVFRLVAAVEDLTEEQRESMDRLKQQTRLEERAIEEKLARIQESVGAKPLMEAAKGRGRLRDGEIVEEDKEVARLREEMGEVVKAADMLRTTTVVRVVGMLNPVQNVSFLLASIRFQKRIKMWGVDLGSGGHMDPSYQV